MSQRDMQQQAAVDGGASTTDGYSPAGEAPPPATRLLDLPPALLDDIAGRVTQLGARSLLPLTCSAFFLAHLLHVPALRIQLGSQCCDQLLTPRVVAALQARTSKLELTLELPQTEYTEKYTQHHIDLLAHALAKLENCTAVDVCKLVSSGSRRRRHLHCTPGLAQLMLDSFPSLTALSIQRLDVSSDALASMLSHPPLALQLQQLDLTDISGQDGDEPGAVGLVFEGLQLKQLRIAVVRPRPSTPPLPSFQPLAQHLTQLHMVSSPSVNTDLGYFVKYLQPLAQLQVLTITQSHRMEGLTELVQVLPQLHTLQLPGASVWGQQQLNALLAATQITSLQLRCVRALDASRADAPCSWQRLELTGVIEEIASDIMNITYLPLHCLSQPLVLGTLVISVEEMSDPVVAAALHHLAVACKMPAQITWLELNMLREEDDDDDDDEEEKQKKGTGHNVISPALLQEERVDLAQLVAMLQPLQFSGEVVVHDLHEVTAADVLALAPLCQHCSCFELYGGSVEPSLEFWHQLVQLMPAVKEVSFMFVKGCDSAAMHESLQLMAEQPWARWLDITFVNGFTASKLPSCWLAGSWLKAGVVKVTMFNGRA